MIRVPVIRAPMIRVPVIRVRWGVVAWIALGLGACLGPADDADPRPGATRGPAPASAPGYVWRLPLGFRMPEVPDANPMSAAKVELGRRLFYDRRVSGNGAQSCSSCHRQELAFTDGRARARGSTGELHPRSAMSLANVGYAERLGWARPDLDRLEDQARVPLLNEMPVEMGVAGREDEVLARLAADPLYPALFAAAFPDDPAPIRFDAMLRALAAFERTLVSGDSPYDRLLFRDERDALSESARRGMALFFSERLGCASCHAGILFTAPLAELFQNTALYDLGGRGRYPAPNEGVFRVTAQPGDMGRFKVPTLRNVAVTAPYMHDGSLETLEDVLDHYARGGRAPGNRYKSAALRGFTLEPDERADVVAFLESLTDRGFLTDPRFASPFAVSAARPPGFARAPGPGYADAARCGNDTSCSGIGTAASAGDRSRGSSGTIPHSGSTASPTKSGAAPR